LSIGLHAFGEILTVLSYDIPKNCQNGIIRTSS
jgi:hypothetical protein